MMGDTMLAALAYKGEMKLRLEEVPIPEIGDDDVLVRIKATGLSHGVLDIWQTFPDLMKVFPHVLGPQMAGYVHRVGKDVTHVKEGDRTFIWPILACGRCDRCQNNEEPECDSASVMGHAVFSPAGVPMYTKYHNGGLAEFVKAPKWNVEKLPDNVSFGIGAFILQASVAYRALQTSGVRPGETIVLNSGTGMAGAMTIKLAPMFGVSKIIVVSRTPESFGRLNEIAANAFEPVALSELPADWAQSGTLVRRLRELNKGSGVDRVLDFSTVGNDLTIQAMLAMRRNGTMVFTGGSADTVQLPYHSVMVNGYCIKGAKAGTRTIARTIVRLLEAGSINLDALITHTFPLAEANTVVEYIMDRIERPMIIQIDV